MTEIALKDQQIEQQRQQLRETHRQLDCQETLNDDTYNMMAQASLNISPRPELKSLCQTIAIIKLNDPLVKFDYTTARCQKRGVRRAFRRVLKKHANATLMFELEYAPNAISLHLFKTKLKAGKRMA